MHHDRQLPNGEYEEEVIRRPAMVETTGDVVEINVDDEKGRWMERVPFNGTHQMLLNHNAEVPRSGR